MKKESLELFQLLVNIEKMDNQELIIEHFVNGLNEIFSKRKISFNSKDFENNCCILPIQTENSHFGNIYCRCGDKKNNSEIIDLLKNSTTMLALILEKLAYERKIQNERLTFQNLAQSRLDELKFHSMLLNTVGQAVIVTDFRGKIIYWNSGAEAIYGWKQDEVLNQFAFEKIVSEEFREYAQEKFEQLITLGFWQGETQLIKKNGEQVPIHATLKVFNNHQTGAVNIATVTASLKDIKEAEHARRESEEKYKALFENAGDGILLMTKDRFVDCNKRAMEMLGTDDKNYILETPPWKISPEYQPDGMNSIVKAEKKINLAFDGAIVNFDWQHLKQSGEPIDFDITLSKVVIKDVEYLLVIWKDITEKKRIEKQLLEQNNLISLTNQTISEVVWQITPDLRFRYISPSVKNLLGYEVMELLGKTIFDLFPENQLATVQSNIESRGELKETRHYRYNFKKKTGGEIVVELSSTPILNEDNKITGFSGVARDITQEYEMEEKVRENERQLSSIINKLPGIFYRCKKDKSWTMIYIGGSCEKVTGYKPAHLIGNKKISVDQLIHPDDSEMVKDQVNMADKPGDVFEVQYRIITKNGEVKYVWERGEFIGEDENGDIILEGMIEDITKSKNVEIQLRKNEEKFRSFMDHIPAGIFIKNTEGEYQFINKFNEEVFRVKNWQNKTAKDFFPKKLASKFSAEDKIVLENGSFISETQTNDINGKLRYLKTNYFTIDNSDNEKLIAGISYDETESRTAKIKLRESEEKFRTIHENAPVAIIICDKNLKIMEWNEMAEIIFGYSSAEVIDKNIFELITDEHQKEKMIEILKKLNSDMVLNNQVNYNITKSGKRIWCEWNNSALRNTKGEIFAYIATAMDVTEKVNYEENLRKYERIISATNDAISLVDTNYRYELVNHAYEVHSNKKAEDLVGLTVAEYMGEETFKKSIKDNFDKCLKGEIVSYQDWFEYPTLGKKYMSITYTPYYGLENKITGVLASSRDITEIKEAELLIQENEEKFRTIFENSVMGIVRTTHEGQLILANDAFANILGYKNFDDLRNNVDNIREIYKNPSDRENIIDLMIKNGFIKYFEFEAAKKDKSTTWVAISTVAELGGDGVVYYEGTMTDINDRKLAEKELEILTSDLKRAQEVAKLGNWRWDIKKNKVTWSDGMKKIWGLDPKNFQGDLGTIINKSIHEDDLDRVNESNRKVMEEKTPIPIEYRIIRQPDNELRYIWAEASKLQYDENGVPSNLIGIIQDITERKLGEQEIRESKERFDLAMDASHDGLFDWNLETNEVYYSPSWKKLLGYEDHELPNDFSIWENLTEPEDVQKSWEMQQKLIDKKLDRFILEFKMKHKNGGMVDILSRAKAYFDKDGKAIRIVGIHTDITEKKKVLELLKSKIDELERFNKAMVGRETKMVELKEEINELREKLSIAPKYKIPNADL